MVQVKVLDTLYRDKMCHLVYMQDITRLTGSALHCLIDSKSFMTNLTNQIIVKTGKKQLSGTMLNTIRKFKESLSLMKESFEKEIAQLKNSLSKRAGPCWFNPRSFLDQTFAAAVLKRPNKKINFKVSATHNCPNEVHGNSQILKEIVMLILKVAQKQVDNRGSIFLSCDATNKRLGGASLLLSLLWR